MSRCPACEEIEALGCNCETGESTSYEFVGTGNDGACFQVEPVIDPDPDNIITCEASGLLAKLPDSILDPPACLVYKTTNTSCTDNTVTYLSFNAIAYDTDTMHSGVNPTRITIQTDGLYVVSFNATWKKNNDAGFRQALIRLNGNNSLTLGADEKNTGDPDLFLGHSVTIQEQFIAGDFIEAAVLQASGDTLLLLAESYSPIFAAAKL